MNKYLKWSLIALLMLAVLFAIGCARSVLEGETSFGGGGVAVSEKTAAPVAYSTQGAAMQYESTYVRPERTYYYDEDKGWVDENNGYSDIQIIKSASMNLEVKDYFLASQKVEAYASKYGGYVSDSNSYAGNSDSYSGTITIRVPDTHFDAVIAELTLLGEIKSKNLGGQDVTEQYTDLEARIDNAEAYEKRLLKMYDDAKNFDEMMRLESELSRIRQQIESMEGQRKYLDNRVEMSSITVYLYEKGPAITEWGVWKAIKNALNHSLATLKWMIEVIGWLLPLGLAAALVVFIVRRLRRKKKPEMRRN